MKFHKRVDAANCTLTAFDWMINTLGQSPCKVAGLLVQPCESQSYTVVPLAAGSTYTPGSNTEPPTPCSCSWSAYNLFQACAICQTPNGINQLATYQHWSSLCDPKSLTNNTWYPPTFTFSGAAVPQWAAKNPTFWGSGTLFNAVTASAIAASHPPDLTTALPLVTKHNSTPVGAIVGGVIGGLALIILVTFLVWYARYKTRKQQGSSIGIPLRSNGHHQPSNSFSKTTSPGISVGGEDYFHPGQLGMTLRSNNTGHTAVFEPHSHGRNISADSGMIVSPVTTPYPASHHRTISDETTPHHLRTVSAGDNISLASAPRVVSNEPGSITPFMLPPIPPGTESVPSDTASSRKEREARGEYMPSISVTTPPNTPPAGAEGAGGTGPRRMNPPAYPQYNPYVRPAHGRTTSNDSAVSNESSNGGNLPSAVMDQSHSGLGTSMASPAAASSSAYPPSSYPPGLLERSQR